MQSVPDSRLLEHLPSAAFLTDLQGLVTWWNAAAEQLFRRGADEAVGRHWWLCFPPEVQTGAAADFLTEAPQAEFARQYPVKRPDGRLLWVSLQFRRLPALGAEPERWLVLTGPAHPAPEAPHSPSSTVGQLEAVLGAINEGVIGLDHDFGILLFNAAAEKTFGYARSTVIGQNARSFSPLFDTLYPLINAYRQAPSETARPHPSLQGYRADGQPFPMEVSVTKLMTDALPFYAVVLRDITLQKQRQQAITQSQKMLAIGALASGVAHDFNNLLTAVLSHLDLVAAEPTLPETIRENLTYAQTSARRGAELVSKLLTFSRQTESKPELLNLYDLSAEVVAMLRRSIDRRIQIHHELVSQPLWLVQGDHSQLMQVLMNLCINARDAMPEGGQLGLRLENVRQPDPESPRDRSAREYVKLTVSDTGVGMSPEVLSRLFEPYFTTKAVGKGTGLGLSIAYSVVTEHGGWMKVESELGVGSQFHAFFPRATVMLEAEKPHSALPSAPDGPALEGHERILVVDDDEMVRLVVRAVLSYRGYQVTEACDGQEAVEKFRECQPPFDLVLLDLNMPRLNGWDAMDQMKEADPKALIILLSGGLTGGETERAKMLGAKELLTKPFENPELVRLVRRTLDAHPRLARS